jgi:type IV pilus assembly protein PilA
MFKSRISRKGFTLVELLLVISILAIVTAVTIVAVNPGKQLAKSRDTQRSADVYSILSSIHQYSVDHDGAFPPAIVEDEREICRQDSPDCVGLFDLSELTENQEYLLEIPQDPRCPDELMLYCSENGSGYLLEMNSFGKITISAPGAEVASVISATR